jgi:hypothetical protein
MRRCVIGIALISSCGLGCRHQTYSPPRPTIDAVEFSAQSNLVGQAADTLLVRVSAINGSRSTRILEFGCGATVARLSTAEPRPRTWDYETFERRRQQTVGFDPRTGAPIVDLGCISYGSLTLAPGDSVRPFWLRVLVRDVLGDSLPPGRYRVTARIAVNGRLVGNLKAGEVDLR